MNASDPLSLLSLASRTAKEAAETVRDGWESRRVLTDLPRDVKIDADRRLEEFIVKRLRKESEYPVLSEETGMYVGKDMRFNWIVDPLDGSLNFSRGIPLCCISIALWMEREPVLGVVYDFNRDEMFSGIVGKLAWINGKEIKVSSVSERSKAILCTGFPVGTDFSGEALQVFISEVQSYKKIRLMGSAALSLAYVACGRADAYREKDIKIWDIAAGLALVKAAGGRISFSTCNGGETYLVEALNKNLP